MEVEDRTIFQVLEDAAAAAPTRSFARFLNVDGPEVSVNYAAQLDRVRATAAWLESAGIRSGDRVALMAGNRPEHIDLWLATAGLGAIHVPLNVALRGDALRHQIVLTSPSLVIAEEEFIPIVREALGDGGVPSVIAVSEMATAVSTCQPMQNISSNVDPHAAATIMFTSGTTGPSKGVTWSQTSQLYLAQTTVQYMGYRDDDVLFTCLPLFHGNALLESVLAALLLNTEVVIAPRFSATRFWSWVATSGATSTNLLGAMVQILLKHEPSEAERDHTLRIALVIPAPPEAERQLRARTGIDVVEGYGLADAGMCLWSPVQGRAPGSCGKPVEGWECIVVDGNDIEVPRGVVGELAVRPTLPWISSLGYWEMPEETVATWRNLWIHTGDFFVRDDDGWFFFIDRSSEGIRRRGENISSFEVEQALLRHGDIAECAVFAIPSDLSEDEVMAAVVAQPGRRIVVDEILSVAAENLPAFAVPRYVRIVDSMPKTETQKVRKEVLKREGVTSNTFDRLAELSENLSPEGGTGPQRH